MNRYVLPLLGMVLLAIILALTLQRAPQKGLTVASALLNKRAPHFELLSVTDPGKTVSSDAFAGRWYLLNVWGTWCAECRFEHPLLLDIQRAGHVALVGLNYKDNNADALRWLAQLGNPYDAVAADPEGRVGIDWGVYGAPETFLVNPEGIIVQKHVGGLTAEIWQQKFLSLIQSEP